MTAEEKLEYASNIIDVLSRRFSSIISVCKNPGATEIHRQTITEPHMRAALLLERAEGMSIEPAHGDYIRCAIFIECIMQRCESSKIGIQYKSADTIMVAGRGSWDSRDVKHALFSQRFGKLFEAQSADLLIRHYGVARNGEYGDCVR